MIKVTVIDYGMGNLRSVSRALEHCGAEVKISSDPKAILGTDRVVLPGVGAFMAGMSALKIRGLDTVIRQVAAAGTPLLGICLGMQMLLEESEEFGLTPGLGLIQGRVVEVPAHTPTGDPLKRPHIGWNELLAPGHGKGWKGSLLEDTPVGDAMYFVHSFMADPTLPEDRLADCLYGGISIAAAIKHDNVMGCQFHPEKSGASGLEILRAFLRRP
ncbi:imidazole glycerol phosphate synthase subunit HisH 1 [Geothrix limicola]|uniref:Imidazole glycerol phosphate synthase subunit HisH n=1 Tax=Geothrix limicola TaxID=2927978 RepID=A0ABQ5QFW2_9BACT|nr:imidazole glycerol phosphate synthase subunit HisH [Geothrix limicola]GLH73055.1 imidazole glycerol phosphate synthase subunit HisH 1 [Geothrix limicola]